MRKTVFLIFIIVLLLAGCSGQSTPIPTVTAAPSPTFTPAMVTPSLIREMELETQTNTAYTLSWSHNGETLAVASGSEITLISADLQEIQTILEPEGGALGVSWNPDESQFATVNGFRNLTLTLWDWDGGDQLILSQQIQAYADQYGISWSPDGKLLATLAGDSKSVIQIWDANTAENVHTFDLPYTKPRRALQWSTDSSTVYGAGESNGQAVFFVVKIADGTVTELGSFSPTAAEVFAISPSADRFAVADPGGVVQIIDMASGDALTGMKSVNQPVDMAWNPNGITMAILDYQTTLQLWDVSR